MDELQVFNNISFGQVRVQELDNEVWFVAKDVCECLGINDTSKWTQKGRLEIHSILTKLNIHAVCEDVA